MLGNLQKLCRTHGDLSSHIFMSEELRQWGSCREHTRRLRTRGTEKLTLVSLPRGALSPPLLARDLLSTGLCLPRSMLCPLVHPGLALLQIS